MAIDKYGKDKNNYTKAKGQGKGAMIKGYKDGGKVEKAPKPKRKPSSSYDDSGLDMDDTAAVLKRGEGSSKAEYEEMKSFRMDKLKTPKKRGYKCGGKVKKGR